MEHLLDKKLKVKQLNPQAAEYYKRMMAMFNENAKNLKKLVRTRIRLAAVSLIACGEFIIIVYGVIKILV